MIEVRELTRTAHATMINKRDELIPYYAFADDELKTYFLHINRDVEIGGCYLFFKLQCNYVNKDIRCENQSELTVGDVCITTDGRTIQIKEVEWI